MSVETVENENASGLKEAMNEAFARFGITNFESKLAATGLDGKSPKKLRELKKLAEVYGETVYKPIKASGTRINLKLASRKPSNTTLILNLIKSLRYLSTEKNRSLARIFRRQSVKFEIKYNRGFLKGDKTLGQASFKLSPFDNRCEIHECLNLTDPEKGRKVIGGKIEVKLRIREPLTDKDVEILKQKWLVIDAFVVPTNRPISASSTSKLKNPENGRKAKNSNQSKVCTIE
ncbi:coiled-coil and C2 domain-containing protein 1A-like [Xenia sp. Carnegie-2017]|uniref:coiled-coil and C2 domain-containing protein 1A-like n=1 Tax=Xenia sp. Carnegie-2017 TaxID=2897299 RepID=UPI001F04046B|nr:coiled-coil and C2 domain-containing protein 1A-like [Xenia sp. Carnegie-2017]